MPPKTRLGRNNPREPRRWRERPRGGRVNPPPMSARWQHCRLPLDLTADRVELSQSPAHAHRTVSASNQTGASGRGDLKHSTPVSRPRFEVVHTAVVFPGVSR